MMEADRRARVQKRKTQEEIAAILSRKQNRREEYHKKEAETTMIMEQISKEIKSRNLILEKLDTQVGVIRKQLVIIQSTQAKHYFELLNQGRDTRGEGLSWIIKML